MTSWRLLVSGLMIGLAACSTPQVTGACQDAQVLAASPLLALAPADVQVAASAIKVGEAVCGSPEYAAARGRLATWLAARTR